MIATPFIASKIAIADINTAIIKNNIKKKRHIQVVNVLKKSIRVTTIIKQILNFEISFIIGKLLAYALVVENQLGKAISEDEALQFCVNTVD